MDSLRFEKEKKSGLDYLFVFFQKLQSTFIDPKLPITTQAHLFNANIFLVLLYCGKTWNK